MSEKKRQKKDGQDKNKLNQARRRSNPKRKGLQANPPRQAKDESNLNEIKERK